MCKLYTAVGRMQMAGTIGGRKCPVVLVHDKEHILDLQEMMLWSILNWRIFSLDELHGYYEAKAEQVGYDTRRKYTDCLARLVQRGLVAEGSGTAAADALYDLLSGLYIIPISENIFLRLFSFLKLTVFHAVPLSVTKKVLGMDKRTEDEKKVMALAKQALLSTAELIKCIACDALHFTSEEELTDALYHDDITTCDNLAEQTRRLPECQPVLLSVSNLYLRKQIIFEIL